jgi:transcriptional regulator with XRE-family HTH domain
MSHWVRHIGSEIDIGVLEESALACAQSTIQNAINQAGLSRIVLARKMNCHRSFVSRMLSGNHNLTIKTMSRALAACGFEVRFQPVPLTWNWKDNTPSVPAERQLPAQAGSTMSAATFPAGIVVPARRFLNGGGSLATSNC